MEFFAATGGLGLMTPARQTGQDSTSRPWGRLHSTFSFPAFSSPKMTGSRAPNLSQETTVHVLSAQFHPGPKRGVRADEPPTLEEIQAPELGEPRRVNSNVLTAPPSLSHVAHTWAPGHLVPVPSRIPGPTWPLHQNVPNRPGKRGTKQGRSG